MIKLFDEIDENEDDRYIFIEINPCKTFFVNKIAKSELNLCHYIVISKLIITYF